MSRGEDLSSYLQRYRRLEKEGSQDKGRALRIAILSSFTLNGMKETLTIKCHDLGVRAEIYAGVYGQYHQEIIDEKSRLYAFSPDLLILAVDVHSLLGRKLLDPYDPEGPSPSALLKEREQELADLVETFKNRSPAKILIHNLEVPLSSPLGILEHKQKDGIREAVIGFNSRIAGKFREDSQTFVLDYEGFCAAHGKDRIRDDKMYYLGDLKLSLSYIPALADRHLSFIRPLAGLSRKCLVLDLDNTLWGGIIGEDGIGNIALGPTPEGRPFLELQQYILALYRRGVILAINSRNNEEEVRQVFREHPDITLKEEHFAAMRINWEDKADNLRSIAEELNLGLESMVFVDDDPVNRELIRKQLPEVEVIELPPDPSGYLRTLQRMDDFDTMQLTEEDRKKGELYAQERRRRRERESAEDLEGYLKALGVKVSIRPADEMTIPRIAQLTQKTNQFNMTAQRYQQEDILAMRDKGYVILSIRAEDRFGDSGIVGVAIADPQEKEWRIDTFLLSCRVLGRGIEQALLASLIRRAREAGAERIVGEFISTKKNAPAKDFYQKAGFTLAEENKETGLRRWVFSLSKDILPPGYIEVLES